MSEPAKERILKTAIQLFYQKGIHDTGINLLIKEADVAKASFYQHYPSKNDLIQAYVEWVAEDWNHRLGGVFSQEKEPIDKIKSLFINLEKWAMADTFKGCHFLHLASELRDNKIINISSLLESKSILKKNILKTLTEAYPKRSNFDLEDLSTLIYLLYEGALAENLLQKEIWPIQGARKQVTNLL